MAVSIPDTRSTSCAERVHGHVLKEQSGLAVDQEDLLDPEHQAVTEHDLGERPTGLPRLDPPPQARGEKLCWSTWLNESTMARSVSAMALRIAGPSQGEHVGEAPAVLLDRVGERLVENRGQGGSKTAVRREAAQGMRQDAAQLLCPHVGIAQPAFEIGQPVTLGPEEQPSQPLELFGLGGGLAPPPAGAEPGSLGSFTTSYRLRSAAVRR